jgi:hypothetical protein
MELPNNTELCKQVFIAQPKPHRIKYAKKHRVVKADMLKLQEFFEGCHDADVRSGMYPRLLEGKKPKDESKPNKPRRCNCNKPPESVDHRD